MLPNSRISNTLFLNHNGGGFACLSEKTDTTMGW
jgi:hypothetical protein